VKEALKGAGAEEGRQSWGNQFNVSNSSNHLYSSLKQSEQRPEKEEAKGEEISLQQIN